MPARLAPKGINVKEAYQTFSTDPTDSFNAIAGTLGTNRLQHLNVSLAWCSRVSGPWSDSRISSAFRQSWFAPIITERVAPLLSSLGLAPWICRSAIESQTLRVPKPS